MTKNLTEKGTENYTTFSPPHRKNLTFFQYDYRHTNGVLFSCVAPTLDKCRVKRDKWIETQNSNNQ